jgi:hypothetical protein
MVSPRAAIGALVLAGLIYTAVDFLDRSAGKAWGNLTPEQKADLAEIPPWPLPWRD